MYGEDALIQSACRQCGEEVRVSTRQNGEVLGEIAPGTAVVWSGIRYANDCAADSLCTVIAFFCSDAHLEAWRAPTIPTSRGSGCPWTKPCRPARRFLCPCWLRQRQMNERSEDATMTHKKLLCTGAAGSVIAALCCFTPLLVVVFVRRQSFLDRWLPDLREALAHLVGHSMRRICDAASADVRWSGV